MCVKSVKRDLRFHFVFENSFKLVESKVKATLTRESRRRAQEKKQEVVKAGGDKGRKSAAGKAKSRWHV